jgi:small subunit ribosomal protein S4
MILGPKYKIARRLNAPIFEKTQTQKYAMSLARRGKEGSRPKTKTNFGRQLTEKQKARFTYGMNERQFSNYAKSALAKKANPSEKLVETLESRLDNVIYRLGIASTRRFARQIVSHGHIVVNGKKLNIPSYLVSVGDVITIRKGSQGSKIFTVLEEKLKTYTTPAWLSFDVEKKEGTVNGVPKVAATDLLFDPKTVLEFYSR